MLKQKKLHQIMVENKLLGNALSTPPVEIGVISNITINQIKDPIELSLREKGINASVEIGDYDNIVQDSHRLKEKKIIIVFWEVCNFLENFNTRINSLGDAVFEDLVSRFEAEIALVLQALEDVPLVLFNRFSSIIATKNALNTGKAGILVSRLNIVLDKMSGSNVLTIDVDKIIANIGTHQAIDIRQFYFSKALYSFTFIREYIDAIAPALHAVNGFSKKVLVLDCDNTLWGGVLGEDGIDGIDMSKDTRKGKIFTEIHERILALKNQGIILAICSKNNQEDIENVFTKRSDFALASKDFVAKRINWNSKDENIAEIAKELNVGLDSLVFLDDSSFEIGNIEARVPDVVCFCVPSNLSEYPALFDELEKMFFTVNSSTEDLKRSDMYRDEAFRRTQKASFASQMDYIRSLDLKIKVSCNEMVNVARASQLTQKTNQFNLTTKRYSEPDITAMIMSDKFFLLSFSVQDKYGDYGTTGLVILERGAAKERVIIDTFLMSCRIIGRKIEIAIVDYLIKFLREEGFSILEAKYLRTSKNKQTMNFFDSMGFTCTEPHSEQKNYFIKFEDYTKMDKLDIKIKEMN